MGSPLRSTRPHVHTSFMTAATIIVESVAILTEFSDPPVDPGNISRRLGELKSDSDDIAYQLRDLLDVELSDTGDLTDLSRLARLLDAVVHHLEMVGEFTRIHDLIALPEELIDLITILLGCAQLTAMYIASSSTPIHRELYYATMEHRTTDAMRVGNDFLVHRPARIYTSFSLLEVGAGLDRAARAFGHLTEELHAIDGLK